MASLRASEEGQAKITAARKSKGWLIKAEDTRPLRAASKHLVHRYGRENELEDNDPQWVKDLDKFLRIDKDQVNEFKVRIAKWQKSSLRDRIEQTIEEEYFFARDISYGSWSRFAGSKRHAVKERAFQAYCQSLGLAWEEIVERDISPTPRRKARKIERSLHNLPAPDHTAFIGRQKELNKLLELLAPDNPVHRISVEGEGGLGKTALVLEVAYRCLRASLGATSRNIPIFDAIIFVSAQSQRLVGIGILQRLRQERTQRDIFRAIARTLDLPALTYIPLAERFELLQERLAKQSVLLIVDNLETVEDRDAILAFVHELPPTVKVIVTTREPAPFFRLRLDSLLQEDALDLIFHQVEEKDVELSPEEAEALYQKTTGLPAAIVYTIGQLAVGLTIEEIIQGLTQTTNDVSRYCFEGSVKLLSESAHHLLMALALFPQVALREAIAKVSSIEEPIALAEGLAHLRKLSLIKQVEERYTMLPATRSYVFAQLEDTPAFAREAKTRWLDWFLSYVRQHGSEKYRDWQDYSNLEREWGNLSAAIEWCLGSEQYDLFKEFCLYLAGFTRFGGYWDERLAWSDCLLEVATREGDRPTIARTLRDKVDTLILIDFPAQQEEAIALCQEALAIPDGLEFASRFNVMVCLVALYLNQKQFPSAQEWLDKARIMVETATLEVEERSRLQIYIMYYQAQIELESGNLYVARSLYKQCLQQAQESHWQLMIMYAYGWLAILEIEERNFEEAERLLKLVLTRAEQNGDKRSIALCQRYYALLEQKRGDLVEARRWALLARENLEKLKMLRELREIEALCHV
ncbi:MAG: NB-ARC domain-containing protein [Cyanobacteria bacterium P01_E01_bin.42]